jgi:hypothetical protein
MINKVINFGHSILIPECDAYIKNIIESTGEVGKKRLHGI